MWTLSWGAVLVAAGTFGVDIFKKTKKATDFLFFLPLKLQSYSESEWIIKLSSSDKEHSGKLRWTKCFTRRTNRRSMHRI